MRKCWHGPSYANTMDMKLAWAAALLAGKKVTNAYTCEICGMWHLGYPKTVDNVCQGTGKVIYANEQEAQESLQKIIDKRLSGSAMANRREQRTYRCPALGCNGWHLTSLQQTE